MRPAGRTRTALAAPRSSTVRADGNYQRRRVHPLAEPVTTDRLRLVVHATNGDLAAAVYEIRCYPPDDDRM